MARDRATLEALVAEVGRFYIRDRTMRRAQAAMSEALAAPGIPEPQVIAAYAKAVARYFGGFEREARGHLGDLERRLGRVAQLQYNLMAERGVAARRIEVTQGVLARLSEIVES